MARKAASAAPKTPELVAPPGPARVVLIAGQDAPRKIAEAQKRIAAHLDPDFADFDAETIDGSSAPAERILSAVATVPLGTGKKVVLVRDPQQMEPEEQKRLAAGLGGVPASGYLILLTGTPITEEGKTKRGTVVATELASAVKKVGETLELGLPKADDLRGLLVQRAKATGKTLAPEALTLLAQLAPDDVARIDSELAKAAAHAGDAPVISSADVEATLSRTPDDVIFKLCDAVGARRTAEALGHVATLLAGGARAESVAPRVLVMLARQIRLIAQFRYLGEKRMAGRGAAPPTPEVLALMPADGAGGILNNPRTSWMADRYVAQARNFTGAELAARLEILLQADLALKGIVPGGTDPRALLQRLVVELC